MNKETHKTRLLSYLKKYGKITPLEAIRDLGNTRLSATIFCLREDGHSIKTKSIEVPTRFGKNTVVTEYSLNKVI